MAAPNPPLPPEVYVVFSGQINSESLTKMTNGMAFASGNNVRHVHLMFHSVGGFVGDGIALYNLFRALPFDLTLYNPGIVASIGTIAFLGARHRKVSPRAIFMIHRTQCNVVAQSAPSAQAIVDAAKIDDERTEAILRANLVLPDDSWAQYSGGMDVVFTAQQAVDAGFADEIADFSPPPDTTRFWNF